MGSKAKILGHSIHQILIVFPLGLLGASAQQSWQPSSRTVSPHAGNA